MYDLDIDWVIDIAAWAVCAELGLKLQSSLLTLKSEISEMIRLKKKKQASSSVPFRNTAKALTSHRDWDSIAAVTLGPWGSLGPRLVGLPALRLQAWWGCPPARCLPNK